MNNLVTAVRYYFSKPHLSSSADIADCDTRSLLETSEPVADLKLSTASTATASSANSNLASSSPSSIAADDLYFFSDSMRSRVTYSHNYSTAARYFSTTVVTVVFGAPFTAATAFACVEERETMSCLCFCRCCEMRADWVLGRRVVVLLAVAESATGDMA